MKLSVSAFRAQASAQKKILSTSWISPLTYGSTSKDQPKTIFSPTSGSEELRAMVDSTSDKSSADGPPTHPESTGDAAQPEATGGTTKTAVTFQTDHPPPGGEEGKKAMPDGVEPPAPSEVTPKSGGGLSRSRSNQCWMKLRTTVQLSNAIQKPKPPLKREDSFLKRFSTRQIPDTQETMDTGDEYEETGDSSAADGGQQAVRRLRVRRKKVHHSSVVNPDSSFYVYWLFSITVCVLYNLWTLIVRQSFPELQENGAKFWFFFDYSSDTFMVLDILVQFRTGYLEQGLMVYNSMKLAGHYVKSRAFMLDIISLLPLDLLYFKIGVNPMLRFPRFFKVYRVYDYYYIVESRTVYPNLWRVVNLVHILLITAHWFGCFYFLLSQAEGFYGDWVYPYRVGEFSTLTRKYLGSIYWSTLTLTTIGDLPQPETNLDRPKCPVRSNPETRLLYVRNVSNPLYRPKRGRKSRILQYNSNVGYIFTMVSYLMGVFIFATIVGQVGNVITNRNANRLEFERLLDGAKTYMRHHKVPGGMKRRVLRWYDYSWSRGRIQGGGDINTALGLLPDKLKTELALHVNLVVLKKVTIFQECQPEFLHDLVLKMKAYIFTPGDLICRKGEVAREMFIIADGILEVISESGRVLTTMKAGDFFGEIGILNLDGLNKRTADVRSVGYAELFSLSREDVLSAMKDYPEAQEILQNLGRKRLMEAKNMNRKFEAERTAKSSTDTTPDGDAKSTKSTIGSSSIVEKIKHDVKSLGFLRKGRLTKGRDESFELEPLTRSSGGKPKMTRMKRVCSDENSQDDETTTPPDDSKIGAGLPILARLKLLKEKESENLMSPTTKSSEGTAKGDFQKCLIPSIQKSIALLPSPQKAVSLIPTKTCDSEKETGDTVIGQGLPLFQRLKLLKQKEEKESRMIQETANSAAQILSSCTVRTQHATNSSPKPRRTSSSDTIKAEDVPVHKESKVSLDSKNSLKTNLVSNAKPSVSTVEKVVLRESSMLPTDQSESSTSSSTASSTQPWTKLKNATIVQSKTDELLSTGCPQNTGITGSPSNTGATGSSSNAQPLQHARVLKNKKMYKSIEDLSPEYAGLPFVKKLKILNERQKLAELERKVFTKSLSLDSGSTSTLAANESNLDSGDLTRSNSEALAMDIMMRGLVQKREVERMKTEDTLISFGSDLPEEDLILSDSNETIERQCLKSILKRISADIDEAVDNKKDLKKLMRSPTVEGYVARRSKLTKSVTFNDTFTSPPKTPMNVSPLLSPLPPTQEANTSSNLTDDGKRFFNLTPITESPPSLTPVENSQSKKPMISISDATSVHSESVTCSTVAPDVSLLAPILPVVNNSYVSAKSLANYSGSSDSKDPSSASQTTISTAQTEQSCSSVDTTSSKLPEYNIPIVNTSTSNVSSNRIDSSVTKSFSDLVTSSFPNSQSLSIASMGSQDQSHFSPGLNLNPDLIPFPNANNLEPKVNSKQKNKSKVRRKFYNKKMISNEEEYFSNILGGIKSVIEDHLYQMESKFYSHLTYLESEIRKRDLIIKRLRSQLYNSNDSVDPNQFGQDINSSVVNENPYESENEEESENWSGEYQVMSDEEDEIPFMRDDSIDTIYCRSPPPSPNHLDEPNYKFDHPYQSRLTHQSSYSSSRQPRGNKDFNIENWKSLDITLKQSRVVDDQSPEQSEAELKQYVDRRKMEYDKSRRLKIAEERYKLLQDQNDEILSIFKNDSSVAKKKEFFDRSIQRITLLDSLQDAENDKVLQEELRAKDKKIQEYEQKRLLETINSRIEYEIKQIRSRSLDQDLNALSKGADKRRSWDESSSLRGAATSQVKPKTESVQIEIESDNEEIVPNEIRDVNYRSHDTNWEINMLADQWTQK